MDQSQDLTRFEDSPNSSSEGNDQPRHDDESSFLTLATCSRVVIFLGLQMQLIYYQVLDQQVKIQGIEKYVLLLKDYASGKI